MEDHKRYVSALTSEESMLLTLRDELYKGDWDRMLRDLEDRRQGRPYVFKLVNLINEDIQRIGKLRAYELAHGVNLSDFLS